MACQLSKGFCYFYCNPKSAIWVGESGCFGLKTALAYNERKVLQGGLWMKERQVAVVDIGSNTVRLVIYRITELNDFHELQNVKLPAQLYQYL